MTYKKQQQALLTKYTQKDFSLSQLLENKYDLNFTDEFGRNLLHIATIKSKADDVLSILSNELIDPNIPDNEGDTPLHLACYYRNIIILHILLQHTAKPNLQNNEGQTPFYKLNDNDKNILTSEFILKHNIDLNSYDKNHLTLFNKIFRDNALESLSSILDNKQLCKQIKWDTLDKNGNNLLTSLIFASNTEKDLHHEFYNSLTKKFIEFGVKLNHMNLDGNQVLAVAAESNNLCIVKIFKNNGADFSSVNFANESFGTFLNNMILKIENEVRIRPSEQYQLKKVEELKNINEYLQQESLYTPSVEEIKKQLEAKIEAKDYAVIKKIYNDQIHTSEYKQELLDHCLGQCLSAYDPKIQMAKFFIKNGANINSNSVKYNQDNNLNITSFLYAIYRSTKESMKVVEFMLENKYDPTNDIGAKNKNAMHYLAEQYNVESQRDNVLKKLLKFNININQQDHDGDTPLHILLNQYKIAQHIKTIDILLQHNPNVIIENNNRETSYLLFLEKFKPRKMDGERYNQLKINIETNMEKIMLHEKINNQSSTSNKKHKI